MLEAPIQASVLSLGLLLRMTRQNESRLLPKIFEVTGTYIDFYSLGRKTCSPFIK
jgi:hypothetical protein